LLIDYAAGKLWLTVLLVFSRSSIFVFMTVLFSNSFISMADKGDLTAITALLNSAYRGESSKEGWTHEGHLINGNVRTNEAALQKLIEQQNSVLLKYTNAGQTIIGCVNLQKHEDRVYLGMLSVSPKLQGGGVGKQLLKAADEYAQQLNCRAIYMTVISVRSELINWYQRHGYEDTGKRTPFIEDSLTGKHLQPLEFMVLEKVIAE
jgi:ribosomal protein S18 acetylase RimI-like enzyme